MLPLLHLHQMAHPPGQEVSLLQLLCGRPGRWGHIVHSPWWHRRRICQFCLACGSQARGVRSICSAAVERSSLPCHAHYTGLQHAASTITRLLTASLAAAWCSSSSAGLTVLFKKSALQTCCLGITEASALLEYLSIICTSWCAR